MELIRGLHNLRAHHQGCVATIGNFDGVHLGHRHILDQVRQRAVSLGLPSVAIVFEPQPREFFTPKTAPARLCRLTEKLELLTGYVDRVLCLQFNQKLKVMSADDFVTHLLIDGLAIRHLVVGDDFCFGADRSGDYRFLQHAGAAAEFGVERAEAFECLGERVSSTRVRHVIAKGDFVAAKTLLGHAYSVSGRVCHGQALGRTLGFPTANIRLHRHVSPLSGVYRVKVELPTGDVFDGVCNVGKRPTVNQRFDQDIRLEVHILDMSMDLYGQRLKVTFIDKLRNEQKFNGLNELTGQIAADILEARARNSRDASAL